MVTATHCASTSGGTTILNCGLSVTSPFPGAEDGISMIGPCLAELFALTAGLSSDLSQPKIENITDTDNIKSKVFFI